MTHPLTTLGYTPGPLVAPLRDIHGLPIYLVQEWRRGDEVIFESSTPGRAPIYTPVCKQEQEAA